MASESSLNELVSRVIGGGARATRLPEGRSYYVFKIDKNGKPSIVVKVAELDRAEDLFREGRVLGYLLEEGIKVPRVIPLVGDESVSSTESTGSNFAFLAMEFINGRPLFTAGDFRKLGRAVCELHHVNVPDFIKGQELFDIERLNKSELPWAISKMVTFGFEKAIELFQSYNHLPPVFCHGDLPSNVMIDHQGEIVFFDLEKSFSSSRMIDLAASSYSIVSKSADPLVAMNEFRSEYFSHSNEDMTFSADELTLLAGVTALRISLWRYENWNSPNNEFDGDAWREPIRQVERLWDLSWGRGAHR